MQGSKAGGGNSVAEGERERAEAERRRRETKARVQKARQYPADDYVSTPVVWEGMGGVEGVKCGDADLPRHECRRRGSTLLTTM